MLFVSLFTSLFLFRLNVDKFDVYYENGYDYDAYQIIYPAL
jgi:hypothetical protein